MRCARGTGLFLFDAANLVLIAARAKVVANVFGSTERMIKANEENVGPIAARTRFPC